MAVKILNQQNPGKIKMLSNLHHEKLSEMTIKEAELFESICKGHRFGDNHIIYEYVVRIDGTYPAMCAEFDFSWNHMKFLQEDSPKLSFIKAGMGYKEVMDAALPVVKQVAETVVEPLVPGCEVYVNEARNYPDGHQIFVIVPYEKKDEYLDIIKKLNENDVVHNAFADAFEPIVIAKQQK